MTAGSGSRGPRGWTRCLTEASDDLVATRFEPRRGGPHPPAAVHADHAGHPHRHQRRGPHRGPGRRCPGPDPATRSANWAPTCWWSRPAAHRSAPGHAPASAPRPPSPSRDAEALASTRRRSRCRSRGAVSTFVGVARGRHHQLDHHAHGHHPELAGRPVSGRRRPDGSSATRTRLRVRRCGGARSRTPPRSCSTPPTRWAGRSAFNGVTLEVVGVLPSCSLLRGHHQQRPGRRAAQHLRAAAGRGRHA